jgi:hypothetical protein
MKKISILIFLSLLPFSTLADLNSGLVAYYPFDGSGTNVAGGGLNMTNYNVTFQPGLRGLAAVFTGPDQVLQTPENFPITNNASRTISVWLYPTSIPGELGNILGWGYPYSGVGSCWDLHLVLRADRPCLMPPGKCIQAVRLGFPILTINGCIWQ